MPSPIAHSVTGAALAYLHPLVPVNPFQNRSQGLILASLLLANVADLDFIPHMLVEGRVHHTFTHSLVFAILLCVGIAYLTKLGGWLEFGTAFSLTLAVYGSHIGLDMLGGGTGVTLWWPFSMEAVGTSRQYFPNVNYGSGLIDITHLRFLLFETAYSTGLLILVLVTKRIVDRLRRSEGNR